MSFQMGMDQNPLPFSLSSEAIAQKAESIARSNTLTTTGQTLGERQPGPARSDVLGGCELLYGIYYRLL